MSKRVDQPVLRADRLYLGEDDRIHCGAVACAGMTAAFTGRGLHGGAVQVIGPKRAAELRALFLADGLGEPKCEHCGKSVVETLA